MSQIIPRAKFFRLNDAVETSRENLKLRWEVAEKAASICPDLNRAGAYELDAINALCSRFGDEHGIEITFDF